MLLTLINIFMFGLASFSLGRHISHKYLSSQNWQDEKKKRLAVFWSVFLGIFLLSIKCIQYHYVVIDTQLTYATVTMLKNNFIKQSLNGCMVISTVMGIIFYKGIQNPLKIAAYKFDYR